MSAVRTGTGDRVVAGAARVLRPALAGWRRRESLMAYVFVAPALVHLLVFVVGMMVASAVISAMQWDLLSPPRFVGFQNYANLLGDGLFWLTIRNTFYFVLLTIPTGIACSLALALAVNTKLKGIALFRAAYFVPFVVSMVAVAVVWRWIYSPDYGLLNWFLGLFGVDKVNWLGDSRFAMIAVAVMFVWKSLGWNMTLFLAGLQTIPQHLYEAAELDGANAWRRFRHITWPLLTPTTFFVTVTTMIGNFQVFDAIYLMTRGGPGRSTEVYNYLLYNHAFKFFNMGTAAAMAWMLCALLGVLVVIQFRVLGRRVQYELG